MSGTTRKYSVSIPEDLAETVRAKVGPGEFSAYITAALRQRLAMERLSELVDDHEARHGAFSETELAAADALLGGTADSPARHGEERSAA
ncbi:MULTISPECIES: hypothetical protein [Streptomyces]|uniref:Uncharacterized protein n=1 Tax=Streptomyces cremeus TaxID=66881 RepID=A0ABV5PCS0_STRCM